jgi:very-short-patch-repair endonuclease
LSEEERKEKGKKHSAWFKDSNNRLAYDEKRSFPSEIKHWIKKGFSEEEARQKVSEWQTANGKKQNNLRTKEKISKRVSGSKNPMSIESIMARHGVDRKTARMMTPAYGRLKEKHPMWGKKHTEEALQKIASSPHLCDPIFRSKAEIELFSQIQNISPSAKSNFHFKRWNIDSIDFDKKIVVEYFGDFWHMNPQKYLAKDMHAVYKHTKAHEIWAHDMRKLESLKNEGFEVIVVWESDWKNDKESCLKRIKDAYDRTR